MYFNVTQLTLEAREFVEEIVQKIRENTPRHIDILPSLLVQAIQRQKDFRPLSWSAVPPLEELVLKPICDRYEFDHQRRFALQMVIERLLSEMTIDILLKHIELSGKEKQELLAIPST